MNYAINFGIPAISPLKAKKNLNMTKYVNKNYLFQIFNYKKIKSLWTFNIFFKSFVLGVNILLFIFLGIYLSDLIDNNVENNFNLIFIISSILLSNISFFLINLLIILKKEKIYRNSILVFKDHVEIYDNKICTIHKTTEFDLLLKKYLKNIKNQLYDNSEKFDKTYLFNKKNNYESNKFLVARVSAISSTIIGDTKNYRKKGLEGVKEHITYINDFLNLENEKNEIIALINQKIKKFLKGTSYEQFRNQPNKISP